MSSKFIDLPTSTVISGTVTVLQGTTPWIISGAVTLSYDTNYGVVGINTLRTASQIGNATGAAAFGAGLTSAQTLRVVLPTDQSSIPVLGPLTDAELRATPVPISGTVAATQSGTWNINDITGTVSLPTNAATETTLAALNAKFNSLGQKTSAGSVPVVIASDQSPVPVSGSVTVSGTVTALQGTTPWTVDGTVNAVQSGTWNIATVTTITNPVTVNQGTSPWVISGTVAATQSGAWTTGRTWTLSSGTDSVASVQSGTWNINNITGTISLPTGASTLAEQQTQSTTLSSINANQTNNLQRTQLVNAAGNSAAVQTLGTTPVSSDFGILTNSLIYGLTTGGGGGYIPVKVAPSGAMQVDATQSGTWNINNITGTVSLPTGASTSANQTNKTQFTNITDGTDTALVTAAGELNVLATAQPGVDIGDVTINNAAGASAVNIQDGGNIITVDGTVNAVQSGVWQTELSSRTASQQTYSIQTALTNLGTTETAFVLLKNPNGSGKTLRVTKMFFGINGAGTIRVYHTPTITTNGTAMTIVNRYIKTSPTATVMQAFTTPTISVNGTLTFLCLGTAQVGTRDFFNDEDLILDPNFNILITVQNAANNTPTEVGIEWVEV